MKRISILITALCLLLMAAPAFASGAGEEKTAKCPGKVPVLMEKVKTGEFLEYKTFEKKILPYQYSEVSSSTAGVVKKIEKTAGTPVQAGDIILLMDAAKLETELAAAKNETAKAKQTLAKRKGWKDKSEKAIAQAQQKLDAANAAVKALEDKITACTISAPITGVLASVKVNEGDHVSENYAVADVVNTSKMKLDVSEQMNHLKPGEKLNIQIIEISATVEGEVEGAENFLAFDNADGKVLIGHNARINVLIQRHTDVPALPENLVQKDESGSFVYIVNGKYAAKKMVKTGAVCDGKVMIAEGLAKDDPLIVAEILSEAEGTLKPALSCLQNQKKISAFEKDATGKLVKAGKVPETIKPEPTIEKPKPQEPKIIEKKEPKPEKAKIPVMMRKEGKIKLGAHVSYTKMFSSNFEDVYGRMTGFGLDLSYALSKSLDIWASVAYSTKSKDPDFSEEEMKFRYLPICLDLRYYLYKSSKFDFFAGAGLSVFPFEDVNPIQNVKDTAIGANVLAGTYYHLTDKLMLQMTLRFNLVKKAIENADNELEMNGAELLFGLSYNF